MNEVLHIALSANERYMPGAMVAAAGVAVYAKPETTLHFHLFTEQVKEETYEFFAKTLVRLHPKTEVTRHECDENILKDLPYWAGSRMAAVRCHYATLMPSVDWCLYLDCDVLYLASVEEHFSYCDESVYACVVQEECAKTRKQEIDWIKDNCGIVVDEPNYFNSGVVLFNLARMRRNGIPLRLANFFREHQEVPSPDQDALNAILANEVRVIPDKFNRLQIFLDDKKLYERPVIHYVSGNPWIRKLGVVSNGRFRLWHAFADKYITGVKGASVRKCFAFHERVIKIVCYRILSMPVLGRLVATLFQWLGIIKDADEWYFCQIANDCSINSIDNAI